MKISKASSYAMFALMYMVRHSTLLPVTNRIVAKSEGIPEQYLAKIFQQLTKAQIVVSLKRSNGGYCFARPPEQISVLEVLRTIEGSSLFEGCFMRHCDCGGTVQNCQIYRLWREATSELKDYMSQMSLVDATWKHPEHYFEHTKKEEQSDIVEQENNTSKEEVKTV